MKNHWAAVVISLIATGCSDGPSTLSGSSDGNGPHHDAFPTGAVSFFNSLVCPSGWTTFDEAAGRVIVAANAGLPRGTSVGEPLSSGEDRLHEHALSGSVDVPVVATKGSEPGPNGLFTAGGKYAFMGTSKPAPAGVPYRQLLVCKKTGAPSANTRPLPAKLHAYFDLDGCPSGWKPATATAGRIMIGLPQAAAADKPFGGDPITSPAPRTHTHTFSSTLVTTALGDPQSILALASIGTTGSYPISGESAAAAVDVPMISLLQCEKQ